MRWCCWAGCFWFTVRFAKGSRPLHDRRHRGQDRLDIAAGAQAENRAAVVKQVEFDVAAAPDQLLLALGVCPRLSKVFSHQIWIDAQECAADTLCEGESLVPVGFQIIIEYAADAARLVQVRGLQGDYPYFGKVETTPADAWSQLRAEPGILLEPALLDQFRAKVGEKVKLGSLELPILGVVNKDYEAAAVANSVLNRMIDRKVFDKAKIRSIYKSETFPTTGYGHVYNLDPKLVEKVKEAFFTFPWEGSALKAEFKTEDRFVPITYLKDWSVVRKIDAASGVKYSCK